MRGRRVSAVVLAALMAASVATVPGTAKATAKGAPLTACDVPPPVDADAKVQNNNLCATQKVAVDQFKTSYANKANSEIPSDYLRTLSHQVACGEFGVGKCPIAVPVWVDIWGATVSDPYRMPDEWAAAGRGNTAGFYFNKCNGVRLAARMFWPNPSFAGPMPADGWPGIVISTGSVQAFKEIYYWSGEGLAEAGYMVLMYDVNGQGQSDAAAPSDATAITPCDTSQFNGTMKDALDFLESTPSSARPNAYPGTLAYNPHWNELDRARIGIAGHSAGAAAVSTVGQQRCEVKALVAWDSLSNLTDKGPANSCNGVGYHAHALSLSSEYAFNITGRAPSDTKSVAFNSIVAFNQANPDKAVDAMIIWPRSSTHLEYDYVPYVFTASRYGERVSFYYTLAWFDRYVKGLSDPAAAALATARLTATRFDDSADVHSIGAGTGGSLTTDTGVNLPYQIAGDCMSNRLSVYNASQWYLNARDASPSYVTNISSLEPNLPAQPADPSKCTWDGTGWNGPGTTPDPI